MVVLVQIGSFWHQVGLSLSFSAPLAGSRVGRKCSFSSLMQGGVYQKVFKRVWGICFDAVPSNGKLCGPSSRRRCLVWEMHLAMCLDLPSAVAAWVEADETNSLLQPKREVFGELCSEPPGFLPGGTPLAAGDVMMLAGGLHPRPCPSGSALGLIWLILGHWSASTGLKAAGNAAPCCRHRV